MTRQDPVLIAGGGIAGLTLALALARRGIRSRILERNQVFSEAGAGIQIGPNGIGVLRRLGLTPQLSPHAAWPAAIVVRSGASGRRIARFPLGAWIARRHGEPYGVVHRADLQNVLLDDVRRHREIEIVTGFKVEAVTVQAGGVSVDSDGGDRQKGGVLIGADGLWSTVRRYVEPEADLNFSGKIACRTVVPIEKANAIHHDVTTVWLMPGSHVVHYPVRGGKALAIVAVVDGPWPGRGFGNTIAAPPLLKKVAAGRDLALLLAEAGEWRSWALYDPEPLGTWWKGPIALIGDAAHPILPFLAQGGVMALEDAETLAVSLARYGQDPAAAFGFYEAKRRPRVERVQNVSRRNGAIFHARGATALARNFALGVLPGMAYMARYDWLYGFDGPPTPP